ncbi:putative ribosomal N-acetyltransferase YdaF [Pseudovibrio axinellae]|uniref:Putative ribosomal N-acetyltransferase YdaF n=1 Tax=Pseudovibrio axinellae TaxID=989403 RepID=A0A165YY59_9HYPH|nr:GNAT family N-acetyltransferase [Pseudovibrio axinellae]KZL19340.1 putative ribosomal N-acetyltransferase YdaF [Pseudovibrio axinellae]SEQ40632.1 Protein N-acetyltransferase, RimJ/RimL family [Pseudovibrio axinellae]
MFPQLTTDRLVLREVQHGDLTSLCKHINNYKIAKMLSHVPFPYTREDGEWWVSHSIESPLSTQTAWVLDHLGEFLGVVSVLDTLGEEPFLGYWVAEPHWNQGFASEAVAEAIRYCFEQLQLKRLYSSALSENEASLRVLRKSGFKDYGIGTASPRARQGEELETTKLHLTKQEWEAEFLDIHLPNQ